MVELVLKNPSCVYNYLLHFIHFWRQAEIAELLDFTDFFDVLLGIEVGFDPVEEDEEFAHVVLRRCEICDCVAQEQSDPSVYCVLTTGSLVPSRIVFENFCVEPIGYLIDQALFQLTGEVFVGLAKEVTACQKAL